MRACLELGPVRALFRSAAYPLGLFIAARVFLSAPIPVRGPSDFHAFQACAELAGAGMPAVIVPWSMVLTGSEVLTEFVCIWVSAVSFGPSTSIS